MLTFNEPTELVLRKVISGGQIGADEAGLFAARSVGLETGGTAPMNFRTHKGSNMLLKDTYGLTADESFNYKPRTIKNVMGSDGTVIIAKNLNSPGCALTWRTARQHTKPCFTLSVPDRQLTIGELARHMVALREWLVSNQIEVLNVAGNRDHLPSKYKLFDIVVEILTPLFEEAKRYENERTAP